MWIEETVVACIDYGGSDWRDRRRRRNENVIVLGCLIGLFGTGSMCFEAKRGYSSLCFCEY